MLFWFCKKSGSGVFHYISKNLSFSMSQPWFPIANCISLKLQMNISVVENSLFCLPSEHEANPAQVPLAPFYWFDWTLANYVFPLLWTSQVVWLKQFPGSCFWMIWSHLILWRKQMYLCSVPNQPFISSVQAANTMAPHLMLSAARWHLHNCWLAYFSIHLMRKMYLSWCTNSLGMCPSTPEWRAFQIFKYLHTW